MKVAFNDSSCSGFRLCSLSETFFWLPRSFRSKPKPASTSAIRLASSDGFCSKTFCIPAFSANGLYFAITAIISTHGVPTLGRVSPITIYAVRLHSAAGDELWSLAMSSIFAFCAFVLVACWLGFPVLAPELKSPSQVLLCADAIEFAEVDLSVINGVHRFPRTIHRYNTGHILP